MSNRMIMLALSGLGIFTAGSTIGCAEHSMSSEQGCQCHQKHGEGKENEEKEDKIALDKIPQPVTDAVKKEVPDGTITDAEKEEKHGKTMYEIDVKSGDTTYEVKTSEDGKFISKKIDEDEKNEKDKK